jgi:hypothetical protein
MQQQRTFLALYTKQGDDRLADGIGSKSRSARKNPNSPITSQARGTHGGFPRPIATLMKYKDDPDMGKTLQSPERIRLVKGGQDFQERLRFGYQAGLSGYTEFFPETGMNMPYGGKSEMIQLFSLYAFIFFDFFDSFTIK